MQAAPATGPELVDINHFTVRCQEGELPALLAFYRDVLGLRVGPRPQFPFQGHWMYIADRAMVHLAAISTEAAVRMGTRGSGFDHVSLFSKGLSATRERLAGLGIAFEEAPVPGWPLYQVFVHDPVGTRIELTFHFPE